MLKQLVNHKKGERPVIELKVRRVEPSAWTDLGFDKHHYLTAAINPSCKCFLFTWNEQPVAFAGLLNTPRKGLAYAMSISRIVVMPDFQGLGLATRICDWCGGIVKSLDEEDKTYHLYIKTAHRKMGEGLGRDSKWKGTQFDGKTRTKKSIETDIDKYRNRMTRKSYCKEYVGDALYGYEDLLKPIKEMREAKNKPKMLTFNFME